MSLSIRKRTHFSIFHVQSAALLARLGGAMERQYDGKFSDELYAEHVAYVAGSILATVSFLDATVNEVFADCVEYPDRITSGIGKEATSLMAEMWLRDLSARFGLGVLKKFQIALTLAR